MKKTSGRLCVSRSFSMQYGYPLKGIPTLLYYWSLIIIYRTIYWIICIIYFYILLQYDVSELRQGGSVRRIVFKVISG